MEGKEGRAGDPCLDVVTSFHARSHVRPPERRCVRQARAALGGGSGMCVGVCVCVCLCVCVRLCVSHVCMLDCST
jgi:hypothetical protein